MISQYLILVLHSVSLGWAVYVICKVQLYRPFGIALALDSLAGIIYYVSILFLKMPGHFSIYRSIFQAAVWFSFGLGLAREGK